MPSAECAAGIDDEGRAARRRLGGVVRGFDEEAPGDDGPQGPPGSSSPNLIAQWFEAVRRAKRTKARHPATATASGFVLNRASSSHSSGGFRRARGAVRVGRIEAERLNIKLANRLRLVAGAGQGQFPAGHDLAVLSSPPAGRRGARARSWHKRRTGRGGERFRADSRSNITTSASDAASAGNRIQVPRSGQRLSGTPRSRRDDR